MTSSLPAQLLHSLVSHALLYALGLGQYMVQSLQRPAEVERATVTM
jgi:hypothetical protein